MTNGEKIKEIFPYLTKQMLAERLNIFEWWNAEYEEPTTKNDLAIDCISRAEVLDLCDSKDPNYEIRHLKEDVECLPSVYTKSEQEPILDKYQAEIDHLHKYIAKLETQITEDSFINKPCVSSGVCEHDKQKFLDELRAEIEQLPTTKCTETRRIYIDADDFKENVLAILDKYKAESEDNQ